MFTAIFVLAFLLIIAIIGALLIISVSNSRR